MDRPASSNNNQVYKVALASIVGSVIEQYDFLVTGVIAATVWGDVFFKLPGLAAVASAISVYDASSNEVSAMIGHSSSVAMTSAMTP